MDQEEVEGLQWGKPGPGGAYWRNSALTGQNFFDKMVTLHSIVRINEFSFERVGVDLQIPESDSMRPNTVRRMR